ncbi:unnamed protein product [Dicrocoelium dendriticum]|nr:unnamed protein product [Dicrocoelium dendriticum]
MLLRLRVLLSLLTTFTSLHTSTSLASCHSYYDSTNILLETARVCLTFLYPHASNLARWRSDASDYNYRRPGPLNSAYSRTPTSPTYYFNACLVTYRTRALLTRRLTLSLS